MIKAVIEVAQDLGVEGISGDVVPKLLSESFRLKHWYQSLRFTVHDPHPDTDERCVAHVVLSMPN